MADAEAKQRFDWGSFIKTMSWYRRSLNMTQKEFGKCIGVGDSNVSQWEREIKRPKIESLVRMAQLFGVSETELLHPSDEIREKINADLEVR